MTQDTSKRFSEEKNTNSEKVKSGLKPKISAKEQPFRYSSWLKNGFTLTRIIFVSNPESHDFKIYYYLDKFFIFFSWLNTYLAREQINEEMPEIFKNHTTLLDAY